MKHSIAVITALAALAGVTTYAGLVYGQGPEGGSAGGTRIAVVNIAEFLKNYKHATAEGERLNKIREGYLDKVKVLRDQITAEQEKVRKDPTLRDAAEKQVIEWQREIQDIDNTAQKEITKLADQSVVRIYQEVEYFVNQVAKAQGYDLVLCYPGMSMDPTERQKDRENPAMVRMMLQTPAATPFYASSQIDITATVLQTANQWYDKNTQTSTGGNSGSNEE